MPNDFGREETGSSVTLVLTARARCELGRDITQRSGGDSSTSVSLSMEQSGGLAAGLDQPGSEGARQAGITRDACAGDRRVEERSREHPHLEHRHSKTQTQA